MDALKTENKDRYHLTIDGMRIVAILAVLMIHTTTRLLEVNHYDFGQNIMALFFNQIARFAVPLFIMISGFVLEINYDFHQNYFVYLKKRLSKIVVPYIAWSLFYFYFVYTNHTVSFWQCLLTGNASYQLYFIPTLLVFYVVFPVFHWLYKYFSKPPILLALSGLQIYLLWNDYFGKPLNIFYPIAIAMLNYLFFLLGMVAAHHHQLLQTFFNKFKILIAILAIGMGIYVFEEGKNMYLKTYNYIYFYSQWRPSILIYTLLIFAGLYLLFNKVSVYSKQIIKLSQASFFVFFVHVAVIELLWNNLKTLVGIEYLLFPLTVTISYALALVVRKVPMLTKLTG